MLRAWRAGDERALERLAPLVYADLRRLARRHMRGERNDHTLQPTALVNEVYLKLVELRAMTWQDRAHFLAMASRLMRRILVDHARLRRSRKRGADQNKVPLEADIVAAAPRFEDVVAIDEALLRLATHDDRKARVVELRFFGGLNVEETAAVLKVSPDTVKRDWKFARAWLMQELSVPSSQRGGPGLPTLRATVNSGAVSGF